MRHGALRQHAEIVRRAGRGPDEHLVHLSTNEINLLRKWWGEPDVNPNTGLPEYGWFDWVAPIVSGVVGGLGGGALADAAGATGIVADAAPYLGAAALGAGASALQGNNPLYGAVGGAAGYFGADKLAGAFGYNLPNVFGIGGGLAGIGESGGYDPSAALNIPGSESYDPSLAANVPKDAAGAGINAVGGAGGAEKSFLAKNPWLMGAATAALGALGTGGNKSGTVPGAAPPAVALPANWTTPLDQTPYKRTFNTAPTTSTQPGEHVYFNNNNVNGSPDVVPVTGHAAGGEIRDPGGALSQLGTEPLDATSSTYVQGPGSGRSDSIPAVLSDKEYVLDAATVSALGDGSPDEGARRLDEMRANLRRSQGGALSQGKMAPKAKRPEQYMRAA